MSDAIKIKCPKCGEEIELSRGDNVRDVECPACFEKFPMPDVEAEPPTAGHELESRVEPTRSDEAVPVAPSGEPGPSAEADSSRLSYINSIVTILMQ